jgi:hypothetical protein
MLEYKDKNMSFFICLVVIVKKPKFQSILKVQ